MGRKTKKPYREELKTTFDYDPELAMQRKQRKSGDGIHGLDGEDFVYAGKMTVGAFSKLKEFYLKFFFWKRNDPIGEQGLKCNPSNLGRTMCNHTSCKPTRAQKEVAGLVFAYQTQECVSCGSVLWSSENDSEFRAWLGMQKKDHPDKFVIQKVKVSEDLAKFATEIAHSNCTTESSVYQACLALYFVLGVRSPRLIQTINKLQPENQNTVTRKFRVNPNLYVQIEANAKLFEMDMNEISSWVIQRVLSAAHEGLDSTRDELGFALAA